MIAADFGFEKVVFDPNNTPVDRTDDERAIKLTASHAGFGFGDGTTEFVRLPEGSGELLLTGAGLAGTLSGTVQSNLPGVSVGGSFQLLLNTTNAPISTAIITGGLPAGPYVRLTGVGATSPTLTVLGQTLSGNFVFEQLTGVGGEKITRLAADQVTLSLRDGTTDLLKIDQGRGSLFLSAAGLAGQLSAHVNTNTTAFNISAIDIAVNTTSAAVAQTFTIGAAIIALDLPAGPYARVEATGAALNVAGQSLTGDFAFDTATDENAATVIRGAASNVSFAIGAGASPIVSLTEGAGAFIVTASGTAGKVSGSVTVNIPGVSVVGAITVQVNQTSQVINQVLRVGGSERVLSLPAGPYVRVAGKGLGIEILGQTLTGDVSFTKSASGAQLTVDNAALSLADGLVRFTGASASFTITSAGIAGTFSGSLKANTFSFNLPTGLGLSGGAIGVELNTIPAAITETFEIAGQLKTLSLPAGPYVRVTVIGGQLTIGSHPALSGNFFFDRTERPDGTPLTRIAVSDLQVNVTIGSDGAKLTEGEGGFVLLGSGVAGMISGKADVKAGPIDAGARILLRINNTGGAVDETILLAGRAIPLRFGAAEGAIFEVSFSGLSLNIADFVTVEGNVTFGTRTLSDGTAADVFAGEGLEAFLGRGPPKLVGGEPNPLAEGVLLSNARIGLIRVGTTYALVADGTVSLVGVNGVILTGTAHVNVNTTGLAIDETLTIPGSTSPGIVVRFTTANQVVSFEALNAQLSLAGQTLTGNFAFDHGTSADDVRVAASPGSTRR